MRSGHLLNERYQIKGKIGGGGMADVYLARDIILDRDVAIKSLRMEYANDQEFIARFDREAQSATSLAHPNIVSIYDVGEEDHLLYMVMEYVEGMTLKEYIQRFGPLDVQESMDIMRQIASAIAHAHANDIVHRDIKPQNILMDGHGQAKVTDFGIAIALSATALTQTNSILGSVHYLSPEQARGGMATKKSDIYSLGIVLFEMLTGRLPFSGQSPVSIALKHLQSDTPSVRRFNQDIPQSVENIVLKATAKNPFHRYDSIYDFEEAIEIALHPDHLNEEPYTPPIEVGEETKAIPIITNQQINGDFEQETLIHHTNEHTIPFTDDQEESHTKPLNKKQKKAKKPKKQKQKKKKRWLIPLLILIFLLACGLTVLYIYPGVLLPKDVTIPEEIVEMEEDEATEILEELGLVVEDESTFSDDIEEGLVVKTSPSVGRTIKEGSSVTLFVSKGKEKTTVEDYVGRDYNQVKELLESEGFSEFRMIDKHSDRPEGEILSQISPMPNTEVVPSDTQFIFEVSSGPEPISLNNLTGFSQAEAISYLEDKGLQANIINENSNNVEEGNVIRQSPASGSELAPGDTVDVYVSNGPEELPPETKEITVFVPYEPPESEESPEGETETNPEQPEPVEQTVRIYIKDMEHEDISVVYDEQVITEDTEISFTLQIAQDSSAEYRVTRDDELIEHNKVFYGGE
ncbi:Stk1 family PASTA domain-containing Ser/Thr kinase [Oceanobacillus piezotolerans]|uniref:Serine/threonine-protein kinase PrkC n=1 Tax=Oceanobacillus piezotolerans TaxID=2448030 RepID=A0A498DNG1_9BACI|nr:Stk1 family PASTA domain-containing Ser/Thr kinase [Oceanobacillus piezotolerans]RLL45272.1 Stk1 family PASTA domain-containing Ser/Thr kinase [Oceanobacillus piezotolerans]